MLIYNIIKKFIDTQLLMHLSVKIFYTFLHIYTYIYVCAIWIAAMFFRMQNN